MDERSVMVTLGEIAFWVLVVGTIAGTAWTVFTNGRSMTRQFDLVAWKRHGGEADVLRVGSRALVSFRGGSDTLWRLQDTVYDLVSDGVDSVFVAVVTEGKLTRGAMTKLAYMTQLAAMTGVSLRLIVPDEDVAHDLVDHGIPLDVSRGEGLGMAL